MKHNWTLDELIDSWTLLPNELESVSSSKANHNRLGFALLLKYFQIEGKFPRHRREVPQTAVDYVARQLKLPSEVYQLYEWGGRVIARHRVAIRSFLGFREGTVADIEAITIWLRDHILPQIQRSDALVETIFGRYRTLKIEPPTAGRVERLARSAVRQYTEQFCEVIAGRLSTQTKTHLDTLLVRQTIDGESAFRSPFGFLKTDAGVPNLGGILEEIEKSKLIRQLDLPPDLFQNVPPGVVKQYCRRIVSEPPREARRHPETIRYTLLAAFCTLRSQEITDNLVDLLLGIIKRIGNNAEKRVGRRILHDIKRVRGKGRILYDVARVSIAQPGGVVSEVIYPVTSEETLQQIVAEYQAEGSYEQQVQGITRRSYVRHYRRMVPHLLKTLTFRSNNEVHQPLIRALALIEKYAGSQRKYYFETENIPLQDVVPLAWREKVLHRTKNGEVRINRISYEVCAFQKLREQLRCKEIWVEGTYRYRNPDEDLPQDFDDRRKTYYEMLQQPLDVDTFVARLHLGIRSDKLGLGSICVVRDEEIAILHSSAALGTATYEKAGDSWRKSRDFIWTNRAVSNNQQALDERQQHLEREKWLASNGRTGNDDEMEYQIAMPADQIRLAVTYLLSPEYTATDFWPVTVAAGCRDFEPLQTDAPETVKFAPETWMTVIASHE